jgi:hypothetical protein
VRCVAPEAAARHQRRTVRLRERTLSIRGAECRARRRNLGAWLAARCAVARLQSHTKAPVPRVLCSLAPVAFQLHSVPGRLASCPESSQPAQFTASVVGRELCRPSLGHCS